MTNPKVVTYLDLLYSNSICRQSSMPTSILMLLFISGYCDNVCTIMSCSLTESDKRFTIVTRKKYLLIKRYHNKQRIEIKKYRIHTLWKLNIYLKIEFIMHCCSSEINRHLSFEKQITTCYYHSTTWCNNGTSKIYTDI